jgi:hypothetical protein
LALRALRDCGVVRARLFDQGYAGLAARRLVDARPFSQHEDDPHPRRDFRLNDRGRIVADAVLTIGP